MNGYGSQVCKLRHYIYSYGISLVSVDLATVQVASTAAEQLRSIFSQNCFQIQSQERKFSYFHEWHIPRPPHAECV